MREYAKVGPRLWHGETFKALRKRGSEGVIVAMYLMTSPSSNMLGLFTQPLLYMAYETGLGQEGALKGLQQCIEVGFCSYDEDSEAVWVHEMAKYQIAEELKVTDLRCKGVQTDYDKLPNNPYLGAFFDRYCEAFHLTKRRGSDDRKKAPSKPLASQEKEQEKEIEKEQEIAAIAASSPAKPPTTPSCPYERLVGLYHEILPELPKVRVMDDGRKKAIKTRWDWVLTTCKPDATRRAETAAEGVEWFRSYFDRARDNDFLMGRTQRGEKHAGWKCDIEFLMSSKGLKQVLERTEATA